MNNNDLIIIKAARLYTETPNMNYKKVAKELNVSFGTIQRYFEKLKYINEDLYKQVKEKAKQNKLNPYIDHYKYYDRVMKSVELYLNSDEDLNMNNVANILNLSLKIVHDDLNTHLKYIDEDLYKQVREKIDRKRKSNLNYPSEKQTAYEKRERVLKVVNLYLKDNIPSIREVSYILDIPISIVHNDLKRIKYINEDLYKQVREKINNNKTNKVVF